MELWWESDSFPLQNQAALADRRAKEIHQSERP